MPGLPHFKIFGQETHDNGFFLGGVGVGVGVGGWVEAMLKICLLVGHSDYFYL